MNLHVERSSRSREGGVGAPRAGSRRVQADSAYLYEIIETISSSPDLITILRGIVRLVTEATQCHACFIYFMRDGQLVLRAASAMYAHLEDKITLPAGKGLTGWVVSKRKAAFIRDEAIEDPRVLYVPELEEDEYQSLASVPIFGRSGDVIGAMTLHAEAPHEFNRADLDFLEHTASLVAGAVENAQLYERATEEVVLLKQLSDLSRQITAAATLADLLPVVVERTRALVRGHRCELYLFDSPTRLVLQAASPERAGARPLDAQQLWFRTVESSLPEGEARALAQALWGEGAAGQPLVAPLVAGDEGLGLLCALVERASPEIVSVLMAVAAHVGVAVKRLQLIESLKEKNLVKDFFEALSHGRPDTEELRAEAARLRCDLSARHVVLHAVPHTATRPPERERAAAARAAPAQDWSVVAGRMEARLRAELPAALFDRRERSLRALLRVLPTSELPALVRKVYAQSGGTEAGPLAVGLSNICQGAPAFARGFEEAASAVQIGALLRGTAGVFTYEDLGPYRYVLSAESGVRDRYQAQLERLVEYERRRGTELLGTLEAYLERQGNMVRTAKELFMHPNTLRQRLARIERVADLDLDHEDWLSLAMAIKAVKLRMMRITADGERREAHGDGD
ncbi:MAG TPA: GAF domain-containing protein [Candidatus Limnocylindrales bacterium]|nr:GAF domain-containing protein [Candidatus Limnocylindrales bacterium]